MTLKIKWEVPRIIVLNISSTADGSCTDVNKPHAGADALNNSCS